MSALEQVLKKIGIFNSGSLIGVGGLKSSSVPYRLQKGLEKINPSKIYFQQEKPLILFFDSNDVDEKSISKKIWNLGGAPIVVFIKNELISIHNGFLFDSDKSLFNLLDKKSQNLQPTEVNLSFWDIVSGKRWLELSKKTTKNKVDERLLDNIQEAQKILVNKNLDRKIANSLIGRLLFARYLLDRDVRIDDDNCFFTDKESFLKLIVDKERLYTFFDYLKDKFNGDLFPVENQEKESIVQEHLDILRNLFEGTDIATKQRSLFDLYDFNIIPIELISEVYERFMGVENQRKEGAYYTPTFLVDYILQKTVRKHLQKQNACKVFDPSCGSGIFLVEALRCIIEKAREQKKDGKELTRGELTTIIKDNIFGVDKDESAANITIFSLYLTLLDYQNPKDISTFKFPNLKNENIFVADFFDLAHPFNAKLNEKKLDFILGNPPWKRIGKGAHINYCTQENIPVGGQQIAQTFTVRAKDFSSINTSCVFVVTSKIFYNHKANGFRAYLLENFFIDEVLELSPVRKQLFKKATAPSSILFYKYAHDKDTKQNTILHTSVKPNIFLKYLGLIVIEKNDMKRVQQGYFQKYDWLWKALLYGNIFDFYFIKRLKENYKTVNHFIEKYALICGHGFKTKDGKKRKELPPLKDKNFIDVGKDGLRKFHITPRDYQGSRIVGFVPQKDVFSPPACLLREKFQRKTFSLGAAYSDKEYIFKGSITAIKGNQEHRDILKCITANFNSDLHRYCLLLQGSYAGVERELVLDVERFQFPVVSTKKISKYVDSIQQINREKHNTLLQNATDGLELSKLEKELNEEILQGLSISAQEIRLLNYAFEITIPLINEEKSPWQNSTQNQLEAYAQNFMNYFGKQWNGENGKYFEIDIYSDNFIVGMNFKVTPHQRSETIHHHRDNDNDKVEQNILKSLSQALNMGWEEITDQFIIQRDIRGFEKHSFYIIKPNEYKNWHPAVAQADLQEFMKDMLEAAEVDDNE